MNGRYVSGSEPVRVKLVTSKGVYEYTRDELKTLPLPPIPDKPDYQGKWEFPKNLKNNAEYYPVYTPIEHRITFKDCETVRYRSYSVEKNVAIPPVTPKEGFWGKWPSFKCNGDAFEVIAEYYPQKYIFRDESGNVLSEQMSAEPFPPIPEKRGYSGKWKIPLTNETVAEVVPEYTETQYTVTFVGPDGEEYKQVQTISKPANPPDLEPITGFRLIWDTYSEDRLEEFTVKSHLDPIKIHFHLKNDEICTVEYDKAKGVRYP